VKKKGYHLVAPARITAANWHVRGWARLWISYLLPAPCTMLVRRVCLHLATCQLNSYLAMLLGSADQPGAMHQPQPMPADGAPPHSGLPVPTAHMAPPLAFLPSLLATSFTMRLLLLVLAALVAASGV